MTEKIVSFKQDVVIRAHVVVKLIKKLSISEINFLKKYFIVVVFSNSRYEIYFNNDQMMIIDSSFDNLIKNTNLF